MKRAVPALLLAAILLFSVSLPAFAAGSPPDRILADTAARVQSAVPSPGVGSIGGEWAVIGLARSGVSVPAAYYETYYRALSTSLTECGGVLHDKKYTEYSRVVLALTSAGYDARSAAGYDLTQPLADFDKTIWQGLNGPIFALLALDSGNYPIPTLQGEGRQATRDLYLAEILGRQLPDGGFRLSATGTGGAEADITGMALQALAKYSDRADVKTAVDRALACLSSLQNDRGGFGAAEQDAETIAQVLLALGELGVDAADPRFVKNGTTLFDALLSLRLQDGGFRHTGDGKGNNQMATEQALLALCSLVRADSGKSSVYRMDDVTPVNNPDLVPGAGLPGAHADVSAPPVSSPGKTFTDIAGHESRAAIEALAARGIVNGKTDTSFDPDATMTRAEFAAIVTRSLGFAPNAIDKFTDVTSDAWYAGPVGTACAYGIVKGVSETSFLPDGVISRQEAAVMVARAANLCGLDTAMTASAVREVLSQFSDYTTAADWAAPSLAFCYASGILADDALTIEPADSVRRCEIADMLYAMLRTANLL
ncbi:S-layer homology domain-containing protein [Oscillospiraceae bacterium OttesenSCG-928-G22]|nr:S-layer homology domain-containing protein [Oscillospiraceae bacterium OttesenSCG-928-G22]